MRRLRLLPLLFALVTAIAGPAAVAAAGSRDQPEAKKGRVVISSFAVVVNAACPVAGLTSSQLSALFLKSATTWPDGQPVTPVDLPADSPVRGGFSLAVHGRPTADIVRYWQENAAGGLTPPNQLASESEVFAFLAASPLGIGYVSGDTPLPAGLKILPLVD